MKRLAILATSLAATLTASAADKITYADNVLPIFRNACLNCHNPDKKKAGLDLSTYQGTLQGSENGKVLDSGNPAGSLLFKCIKGTEDPKMPPKGDKVPDGDLAIIEKWIAGQLLETATGKAVAAAKNNVQVAVVSLERPDGPPPMPGELPMEPFVRTKSTNALTALAVSPWAPLVAVGGQKQIFLYNTETLEPLGVLPFPEGFPAIIKFSRNGQMLMTGGGLGGKSGKVALWDIKTGERVGTVGNEFDQVLAADLSADQQFVAIGGPNKLVKIYATKDGKLVTSIKKHTDWVTAIAYSPDGKYLASADRNGGIQVWEGATGKEFTALPGHKVMVTGLAFMTNVLASSSEDGKVILWDIKESKEIRNWAAHAGGAAWVDFTPDGRLVSCGRDKLAKVWDQTGKELGKTPVFGDIALRAGLSNDRIIAGDWTGSVRVCSLDSKPIGELSTNPPSIAERLALAGKRVAEADEALPPLKQQFTAIEQKVAAEKAAAIATLDAVKARVAELEKRATDSAAELSVMEKGRDEAPEADRPAAQQKLEARKVEIAAQQAEAVKAKADLDAKLAAPADPKGTPAEQELAKAKAALDEATARATASRTDLERWQLAQLYQGVCNARQTLAEKSAEIDGLQQAAKDAFASIEKTKGDIAALEKTVAEAPAKSQAAQAGSTAANAAAEAAIAAVTTAEALVSTKEKALAALAETMKAAPPVDALPKKLEQQNAEIAKLREVRASKPAGTPEYATADANVQAKKAEIAQTQAVLAAPATAKLDPNGPEMKAAQAEVAAAKASVDQLRLAAKGAAERKVAAAAAAVAAGKSAEQSAQQLADLRAKLPEIVRNANTAQADAEHAAGVAEKERAAAKAEAERLRADYEAKKAGGLKSAALTTAQTKS